MMAIRQYNCLIILVVVLKHHNDPLSSELVLPQVVPYVGGVGRFSVYGRCRLSDLSTVSQ